MPNPARHGGSCVLAGAQLPTGAQVCLAARTLMHADDRPRVHASTCWHAACCLSTLLAWVLSGSCLVACMPVEF